MNDSWKGVIIFEYRRVPRKYVPEFQARLHWTKLRETMDMQQHGVADKRKDGLRSLERI